MSYSAFITRVYTRPFPNADRLLLGTCMGSQVIVGKDTENGTLGIFFPEGGQLSERMALENNLMKEQGGYLDEKRRIKALKLRGEKSEGLWLPLESLRWAYNGMVPSIADGEQVTQIGGHEICCRYETPAQKRQKAHQQRQGKVIRGETRFFRKVGETPQLRHVLAGIPEDALVYVTEKLHGTSGRFGRVLEPSPVRWWHRLLRHKPTPFYTYLNGSRNVILEHRKEDGSSFYGSDQFRFDAVAGLELHKGETLYFELVGWVRPETPIMPFHPIEKKDKLRERYGPTMRYSYGCKEGECKLFVYRITQTNEDGVVLELSWTQMMQRCQQLGLQVVPLITQFAVGWENHEIDDMAVYYADGASMLDDSHIREGVVLRIESSEGVKFAKEKSFTFKVLEGIVRDDENYVDTEEAA